MALTPAGAGATLAAGSSWIERQVRASGRFRPRSGLPVKMAAPLKTASFIGM
jgi:hypothetical protein